MRLLIPTIGTVLTLTKPWTFRLHEERRNQKFANQPLLDLDYSSWPGGQHLPDPDKPGRTKWVENTDKAQDITLPKGTTLKVARIYIRNGGKDMKSYDSVTFTCNGNVKGKKGKTVHKGRFWAKLLDVNSMDIAFDAMTTPIPEFVAVQGG
jgi:hypothetical protein